MSVSRECRCTVCLLLPAAVLAFYSLSPSSLRRARGQLKDKRMGHWLEGGRGVRE